VVVDPCGCLLIVVVVVAKEKLSQSCSLSIHEAHRQPLTSAASANAIV
jgi:hypothetical protein